MLQFWFSSLLMNLGKQQKMVQALGPLCPHGRPRLSGWLTGSDLTQPWPLWPFREWISEPEDERSFSLSLYTLLPFKQINNKIVWSDILSLSRHGQKKQAGWLHLYKHFPNSTGLFPWIFLLDSIASLSLEKYLIYPMGQLLRNSNVDKGDSLKDFKWQRNTFTF